MHLLVGKLSDLNASSTNRNSTVQYGSHVHAKSMCATCIYPVYPVKLYLDMGLRKPKKHVKFDQPHLSEKVTYSF